MIARTDTKSIEIIQNIALRSCKKENVFALRMPLHQSTGRLKYKCIKPDLQVVFQNTKVV